MHIYIYIQHLVRTLPMELFLAHQCQHRRNIRDNAAVIIILFSESLCVQESKVHKKQ